MNKIISLLNNPITKISTFFTGIFLLGFASVFVIKGGDEIWDGQRLWIYGLVWLLILVINGLILLIFSFGKMKNTLKIGIVINIVLFTVLGIALGMDL